MPAVPRAPIKVLSEAQNWLTLVIIRKPVCLTCHGRCRCLQRVDVSQVAVLANDKGDKGGTEGADFLHSWVSRAKGIAKNLKYSKVLFPVRACSDSRPYDTNHINVILARCPLNAL